MRGGRVETRVREARVMVRERAIVGLPGAAPARQLAARCFVGPPSHWTCRPVAAALVLLVLGTTLAPRLTLVYSLRIGINTVWPLLANVNVCRKQRGCRLVRVVGRCGGRR